MNDKGMTTMAVGKINKNKVYTFIYEKRTVSKMQIVRDLQMGLSTVNQNLKLLEEEGLIRREGFFESTGGRKAQVFQIDPTARLSIGVGILKEMIHLCAVDLYGESAAASTLTVPYSADPSYYRNLGTAVLEFIRDHNLPAESILGISLATQGLLTPDGQAVSYGVIMGNDQMKLSDFAGTLPYPCRLEHDSKAAACLELWNHKGIQNAVVFLLNQNLGGALIADSQVHRGLHMRSGILEHLCVSHDGPLCYCGSRGCLETYCSANALAKAAGTNIPSFFAKLSDGDPDSQKLWNEYLDHLALAIRNLTVLLDGHIIISGYLAPYFRESDVSYLLERINDSSAFSVSREQILLGTHGQYTPAAGAALSYISEFLRNV